MIYYSFTRNVRMFEKQTECLSSVRRKKKLDKWTEINRFSAIHGLQIGCVMKTCDVVWILDIQLQKSFRYALRFSHGYSTDSFYMLTRTSYEKVLYPSLFSFWKMTKLNFSISSTNLIIENIYMKVQFSFFYWRRRWQIFL
jgi:hypothetical protein